MLAAALAFNVSFGQNMMNEKTVEVGGAAMFPSKNIVENAVNSKDHTTLVAAVKAAGLVETLQSAGPFTVFAPTNAAFDLLPKGTVETLIMPENKAKLTGILTYHVVAGRLGTKELDEGIKKGNGTAELTTVAGGNTVNIATGTPTGSGTNLVTIGSTTNASSARLSKACSRRITHTSSTSLWTVHRRMAPPPLSRNMRVA